MDYYGRLKPTREEEIAKLKRKAAASLPLLYQRDLSQKPFGDMPEHTSMTNIPEERDIAQQQGFVPGSMNKNLMYIEPNIQRDIPPEEKNMMMQANTYRKLNPNASDEEIQAFVEYARKKDIEETKSEKPKKKKYTTKNITDYYGKHAYDKDGEYVGLNKLQRATIDTMMENSDSNVRFAQEEDEPAQRRGAFGILPDWADIGQPNVPAVPGREMLVPMPRAGQAPTQMMPQPTQPAMPTQPGMMPQQPTAPQQPMVLTEEDIQYNMQKYGKTRQEVINKFTMLQGNR